MVGTDRTGRVTVDQQRFERAMGVHWSGARLHLATATQIIRFENMLSPGETGDDRHDAVMVPRVSWTTNDVDAHELTVDAAGWPLFVATKFNCIGTVHDRFSFAPVWMPKFISGSDKGDRCHLNGMAVDRGVLAYASAVSTSDEIEGWRDHRRDGGVIIHCPSGDHVVTKLSMPHSPRVHDGALWFLEAGRGVLARVELGSGTRTDVAFCRGFARGLELVGDYAFVTVSKPRDSRFEGLRLSEDLAQRSQVAWCGVLVIDVRTGEMTGWLRLEGPVQELFDVTVLPGVACPRALGPGTRELCDNVRVGKGTSFVEPIARGAAARSKTDR